MKKSIKYALQLPGAAVAFITYALAVSFWHYAMKRPLEPYSGTLVVSMNKSIPYLAVLAWVVIGVLFFVWPGFFC